MAVKQAQANESSSSAPTGGSSADCRVVELGRCPPGNLPQVEGTQNLIHHKWPCLFQSSSSSASVSASALPFKLTAPAWHSYSSLLSWSSSSASGSMTITTSSVQLKRHSLNGGRTRLSPSRLQELRLNKLAIVSNL